MMEKNVINTLAVILSIAASVAILSSVFVVGPSHKPVAAAVEPEVPKPKIEKKIFFDKIFMHEVGSYSVFTVEEDKTVTIKNYRGPNPYLVITLVCDVEKGDRMWAEEWKNGNWVDGKLDAKIHLHSLDDLNGSGWNHGKHGSGTTVPID